MRYWCGVIERQVQVPEVGSLHRPCRCSAPLTVRQHRPRRHVAHENLEILILGADQAQAECRVCPRGGRWSRRIRQVGPAWRCRWSGLDGAVGGCSATKTDPGRQGCGKGANSLAHCAQLTRPQLLERKERGAAYQRAAEETEGEEDSSPRTGRPLIRFRGMRR